MSISADILARKAMADRSRRERIAAYAVGIIGWLTATVAGYAYLLFGTAERGTHFGLGMMAFGCGLWVGLPCLLYGLYYVTDWLAGNKRLRPDAVVGLCVGLTLAGLFGVRHVGQRLYAADQAEAKSFVERRLAAANQLQLNGGPWPATQAAFVGPEPLPRLLRHQSFYRSGRPGEFEVVIHVDFSGGWHLSSHNPHWRRST